MHRDEKPPPPSHQTVTLARGRHSSPAEGACVMELASMLAGEPYSDHPDSVCPVIGAFLRAYNDHVDDRRRQDLYAYAASAVGTRAGIEVERQRGQMCRALVRRINGLGALSEQPLGCSEKPGRLRRWLQGYCHRPEHAGDRAARAFGGGPGCAGRMLDRELHRPALRFIDELIAVGGGDGLDRPTDGGTALDVERRREAV